MHITILEALPQSSGHTPELSKELKKLLMLGSYSQEILIVCPGIWDFHKAPYMILICSQEKELKEEFFQNPCQRPFAK